MVRYYHPDEFAELKAEALSRGFVHVESGPLVRSSYHAHEQADAFEANAARESGHRDTESLSN
jgi:lipoic acid synthetase